MALRGSLWDFIKNFFKSGPSEPVKPETPPIEKPPVVTVPVNYVSNIPERGDMGADVVSLQKALKALGFDPGEIDGQFGAKTTAAISQLQKANGLTGSGVIGAQTMKLLKLEVTGASPVEPEPSHGIDPPWLARARAKKGVKEKRGGENPEIIEFHSHTDGQAEEDEVPWCAAFVSWALEVCGLKSTHSAWAQSYTNFGRKLLKPIHGCIVVFKWSATHGHVTFYDSTGAGKFPCLGGNQSDQVKVSDYAAYADNIVGLRWPSDYPLPGEQPTVPPVNPPVDPASPRPLHGWVSEYTNFLIKKITPEIEKADKGSLVSNWKEYDQKELAVAIIRAICSPESDFDRCCRFVETGLGNDAVTGQRNTSEGLLQVSYQDSLYYGAEFDWTRDRNLRVDDAAKTIFDPYKNLDCGVRIFTKLLRNHPGESMQEAGARYWSSLRTRGSLSKTLAYLREHMPAKKA